MFESMGFPPAEISKILKELGKMELSIHHDIDGNLVIEPTKLVRNSAPKEK